MSQDFSVTFSTTRRFLIFILKSTTLFYLNKVASPLKGLIIKVRYLPRHVKEETLRMVPLVMFGFIKRNLNFF